MANANAEYVVGFLRKMAERDFPGQVLDFDLFRMGDGYPNDFYGFGVSRNGGLTLVYTDTTGDPAEWWVQVSSALAVDIPDVGGLLQWVNAKNRVAAIGKYYCAIASTQDMAAAVCETMLYGDLLLNLLTSPAGQTKGWAVGWLMSYLRSQVEFCAADGAELLQRLGGRQFGGNEQDLTGLFMMAAAG